MSYFNSTQHGGELRRHAAELRRQGASATTEKNPILEAADIQAQALEDAIPFFEPFYDAGMEGLEAYTDASTPQGMSDLIDQILNTDAFGGLMDQRRLEMQGMLGAGGLTRSGEALDQAAQLPTDLGFEIENMLSGRQGGIADMGYGAAGGIADLTTRVGEAIASGILGLEAQRNANRQASRNRTSNLLGAAIGGFFSDPQLKTNIRESGKIGPLTLVEWDWIPETEGTVVEGMPTKGFLSTDVKAHFPDLVSNFGGYDMIDYKTLFERLQDAATDD